MNKQFSSGETTDSLRAEYNPEGSNLRKAQLRMLEMLKFLDSVAKEIGVEYYIEGGTLLGAVRHGGFIPWDDDADVAMRRSDWERLCAYLKSNPHPQFVLQDHTTDSNYFGAWAVLRDLKSEYLQEDVVHKVRKYRGLQVDLFPLEENPIQAFRNWSHILTKVNTRLFIGKQPLLAKLIFAVQIRMLNPFARFVSKIFPFLGERNYYSYAYGHVASRPLFLGADLFPTSSIQFEGCSFMGPHNPEGYCRGFFGEYDTLPPRDKRRKHHAQYKIWE